MAIRDQGNTAPCEIMYVNMYLVRTAKTKINACRFIHAADPRRKARRVCPNDVHEMLTVMGGIRASSRGRGGIREGSGSCGLSPEPLSRHFPGPSPGPFPYPAVVILVWWKIAKMNVCLQDVETYNFQFFVLCDQMPYRDHIRGCSAKDLILAQLSDHWNLI